MSIDDATRSLLATLAATGVKPVHESTVAEARAVGQREPSETSPRMFADYDIRLGVDGQHFTARVLCPSESPDSVVVYFHGGGWVLGSIDAFDTLGRVLAAKSNAVVLLVNYRKAPEHPYPAAVEDAWASVLWASAHLIELAGRPVPLVVAGDSAGGNLAAVVAIRARDAGSPAIAQQVLVYPVTDADFGTESYLDPESQHVLSADTMKWFWDHYAPVERRAEVDASPLRADSLVGLPPAVIVLAEHDPLRSEGAAYARRLRTAGVSVESEIYPGQIHGFFSLFELLPAGAGALDFVAAEIRQLAGTRTR